MESEVVLPAPFGPRKPKTSPCRTASVRPSTDWSEPKRFDRPSARNTTSRPSGATVATESGVAAAVMSPLSPWPLPRRPKDSRLMAAAEQGGIGSLGVSSAHAVAEWRFRAHAAA